ncbi:unnamed protein product [Lactuca virosa]|uniref:Protein kinase domain-containing protein n=1 Tax=Lactuca virosa TaxID=75947 RepID=A0AAU9NSR4_9ASTR|nr:unnamed protein product [Lactuca virosa]
MSSSESGVHLEKFVIPLEEILSATQNFSKESWISNDGVVDVYKGQLQNHTVAIDLVVPYSYLRDRHFRNQLKIISRFHHQNIIPFIGYCHEGNKRITVSEYAVNGGLDDHLEDPDKRRLLTWADRLKICIGAARGLEYLHSGLGNDGIVIHRNMRSLYILLDDNLEAKISNFYYSMLVERNQPQAYVTSVINPYYEDPVYKESGIANTEADVYSFGLVLFEMVSGLPAYFKRRIDDNQEGILLNLVKIYYDDGLTKLIDPYIRDDINIHSFNAFTKIAYSCISMNLNDRPTMKTIIKRIEEAQNFQVHITLGINKDEKNDQRPAYHQIEFVDGNPQHLINLVRQYYENGPERLIDPDIKDQIDIRSFHTFKEIAYKCISFISSERPTMYTIINKMEHAIYFQELKM